MDRRLRLRLGGLKQLNESELQGQLGLVLTLELSHGLGEAFDCRKGLRMGDAFSLLLQGLQCFRRAVLQEGAVTDHLHMHDGAQMVDHLAGEFVQAGPLQEQLMDQLQAASDVIGRQDVDKFSDGCAGGSAQHLLHLFEADGGLFAILTGASEAGHLVQQADRVAHAALGAAGDGEECRIVDIAALVGGDVGEVSGDFGHRDAAKVEPLATAEDGGGDAVGFGGRKHEPGVWRGLFQSLEQRVEGAGTKHMHFVDDVDLVAGFAGLETDFLAQLTDVVDAVVAGRVDFDQIKEAALIDGRTEAATVARAGVVV